MDTYIEGNWYGCWSNQSILEMLQCKNYEFGRTLRFFRVDLKTKEEENVFQPSKPTME